MSGCDALVADASGGVAAALRAVDCMSAETTASAFARLFGASGALTPVLTLLLTLYIGFFALSLLTGRSSLGISALTPRMLTLGLVLTFATSWAAYQGVIWNLATGAPDQVAGILLGARGSATQLFADRIDILFGAIAETADAVSAGTPQTPASAFSPTGLVWLSAMLLMLGTVGLLITARIALAVLLALGPVFVTLLLFRGTRGLFVGWLRGVVLTATAPLLAILGGSFMVELAVPIVNALRGADGIEGRPAMALFIMAAVHCALMFLALRVASTMVSGWQVFGLAANPARETPPASASLPQMLLQTAPAVAATSPRPRTVTGLAARPDGPLATADRAPAASSLRTARILLPQSALPARALPPLRTRGIGSRFAQRPSAPKELIR